MGAAGLVRPMACFAVIGQALSVVRTKLRDAVIVCLTSALVVVAGLVAFRHGVGSTLGPTIYANDPRAYGGQLFALPFQSLIATPFAQHVAWWKIIYIWSYVVLTLVASGLLAAELRRGDVAEDRRNAQLSAAWLIGNTAFVLCIGSIWGFHEFHRFILPALPPLLWAFRRWYPRRALSWAALGAASFGLALFGVVRNA